MFAVYYVAKNGNLNPFAFGITKKDALKEYRGERFSWFHENCGGIDVMPCSDSLHKNIINGSGYIPKTEIINGVLSIAR